MSENFRSHEGLVVTWHIGPLVLRMPDQWRRKARQLQRAECNLRRGLFYGCECEHSIE